jgi:cystathionine gamma-synthase
MPEHSTLSPETRCVRSAVGTDSSHGAVIPPIHLSSNFAFEAFGKPRRFDYTRSGNPTRSQLADAIADLEGGSSSVITSTGMSAVTLVLQLVRPGDTIVAAHDCYGGTQRLLRSLATRGLFDVKFLDLTSPASLGEISALKPRVTWIETPSNPLLRITNIAGVSEAAKAAGSLVVVDNTFLSPALQKPLELGADIVVHSTTKYLNGHSDVVGSAVVCADEALGTELGWWANCLGITGAPFDSYLTLRGLRTLHVRMAQHLANTELVVAALLEHPAVRQVYYPGLESHPGHVIARSQQRGFGAMVSFELNGDVSAVEAFTRELKCFTLAESLGGVESLVAHPATMTHASMDSTARETAGISESLVRLSVGIENADDLVDDLTRALDAAIPVRARTNGVPRKPAAVRVAEAPRVSVVLMGVGNIGRELLDQLGEAHARGDTRVRVCGVADRTGYVFDPAGIPYERLSALRQLKGSGHGLLSEPEALPGTTSDIITRVTTLMRPVLVDATAAETTSTVGHALDAGFHVVLANKIPLTADWASTQRLRDAASRRGLHLLHEATVGAGLPVLDTLRRLVEAGDEVLSIEGCPSGTLGFLLSELGSGRAFSESLLEAVQRGYTEPDPRIDLGGLDVARKALILARAIGRRIELSDVHVEPLVPDEFLLCDVPEFLRRAHELDGIWAHRVRAAEQGRKVLRYRVRVSLSDVSVGLCEVDATDALAGLSGTDNQFSFTTRRYCDKPLVVRGPGAGAAVTAGGVYNDLLRIVSEGAGGVIRPSRAEGAVVSRRSLLLQNA